jgi:superfamily II DNA or RNA helicase
MENKINNKNEMMSSQMVKNNNAGTITVVNQESNINLYEYQRETISKLQENIIKSNKINFAGLLVLPTGGGKTLTAAYWIAQNVLAKNKKVLWIAHRYELLEQAYRTFKKLAFRDIIGDKEKITYRIISGIHDRPVNIKPEDNIIFSSKDSLITGFTYFLDKWLPNEDEIFLVIDEAHHTVAKTYRRIISTFKESVSVFRCLGLTATPFRTAENEQGLLKKIYPDDIVYKIDLRTLIRLGILSEPHFEEVSTGQNIVEKYELTEDQINRLNLKFGDFNSILGERIFHSIAENRERNAVIVNYYIKHKEKYKKTIIFALGIEHAIALNKLFRQSKIKSDYIISNVKDSITGVTTNFTKENQTKIEKFRNSDLEILINVEILTEGTDIPNVQSVFLARLTASPILMTQMIGRALRGLKAGGTKEAYIVSFIDDWQDKISWINPEKLFIEENVDFTDKDKEIDKQLLRLVAINKIEEFAVLNDQIIDPALKYELEKINFIERFPVGIYRFSLVTGSEQDIKEKNCEVLVYNNILQSYIDFINALPYIFEQKKLLDKELLTEEDLDIMGHEIEDEFFAGTQKYPAYYTQDIKDILQYYAVQGETPPFIELKDRAKYDIDKIVEGIIKQDMGDMAQTALLKSIWESEETAWQTFFNFDEKLFRKEILNAKERKMRPDLYAKADISPLEEKESRELEKLPLHEIIENEPAYGSRLKSIVYEKYRDSDGYYFSAQSGYRSKNKLEFQIDHIIPMSKGGLTVLDNLQLLTIDENLKKGDKIVS